MLAMKFIEIRKSHFAKTFYLKPKRRETIRTIHSTLKVDYETVAKIMGGKTIALKIAARNFLPRCIVFYRNSIAKHNTSW